ncbi:hypothetical protein ACEQPO_13985 [Bacillus sp. SL00103]
MPKEEAVKFLGPKCWRVFEWDNVLPVEKYSKFNALIWAKRIQRELDQQDVVIRYYRNRLWKIHSLLEKLEEAYRKNEEKKK